MQELHDPIKAGMDIVTIGGVVMKVAKRKGIPYAELIR